MKLFQPFANREISWLSFNERVLQEADDATVPLIERIKFLGIFSSNLDEFFRIRVAALKRIARYKSHDQKLDFDPAIVLQEIHTIVLNQQNKFEGIYKKIIKELNKEKIFIINEKQLNPLQGRYVKTYFQKNILPSLAPIMIDKVKNFPYLKDKSIYLAVRLSKKNKIKKEKHAIIEIPTALERFVVLPGIRSKKYVILLDDVIRYCLEDIFYILSFDQFAAWTIKLTRDAELDIDNDVSGNFIEKISNSLKQRKKGLPVRFIYDGKIPKDLLEYLINRIHLGRHDLIPGGTYHNFKDFINFPNIGEKYLVYKSFNQLTHKHLNLKRSIIKTIRERDCIVHLPYQLFDYIIHFLREASIDPKVKAVKITLYRLAQNSNIINALINAAKNGKSITVAIELQARFDEEANINWTKKMEDEGIKVIQGIRGLKVHCKTLLISRKEKGKLVHYANLGTGNYNEITAKSYCDHSFFTSDKRITNELNRLFNYLEKKDKIGIKHFNHLMVAPLNFRKKITGLINQEIKNAKTGKKAYVILKLNHIVDKDIIEKIYEASKAGVKIKLISRSSCTLVPGISTLSENIEVISIVDKFLEHARIYIFCNDEKPIFYLSSADLMTRNLDHRIEVAFPIYNKEIQNELWKIINIQLSDNTKARIINGVQNNIYKQDSSKIKVRSQIDIYNFLKTHIN